jgi:hypothetical protein
VATHIPVILPPLLFDLFLWLGPRLNLETVQPRLTALLSLQLQGVPTQQAAEYLKGAIDYLKGFNLFSALRTFPIGTFSLLSYKVPVQNPLGAAPILDAGSFLVVLGWICLLGFLGWMAGSLYFYWVSSVALRPEVRSLWKSMQQSLLLAILWLAALIFLGLPAFSMFSFLAVISPGVGQVLTILAVAVLVWLAMPVFFSPHGIFTFQLDAFRAILSSLRMARFTLPTTAMFLLTFVTINYGLGFLWNTPSRDSWWTLVGIAGHAFVSTALLAASFVYYRDANLWLKAVFEHLQKQNISARA